MTQKLKYSFNILKSKIDKAKNKLIQVKAIIPAEDISEEMIKSFEVIRDSFKEIEKYQRKMKEKIELISSQKKGNRQ